MLVRQLSFGDLLKAISSLKSKPKSPPSISKSKISIFTTNSQNFTSGIPLDNKSIDPLYRLISKDVTVLFLFLTTPENPLLKTQLNSGTISAESKLKTLSSFLSGTSAIWNVKLMNQKSQNGQISTTSITYPLQSKLGKMWKMSL
jgi:hypothetical protein